MEGKKVERKQERKEGRNQTNGKNRKEGMGGRDGHSRAIKLKKGVYNL